MPATSPEEALMARIKAIFDAEFAAEWPSGLQYDRMSEALGDVGAVAAVYPQQSQAVDEQANVLETQLVVQAFMPWTKNIDPRQQMDPRPVANVAERFRRACKVGSSYVGDMHDWFFRVVAIEYPPDPTGNITRFQALVVGYSQNPSETSVSG